MSICFYCNINTYDNYTCNICYNSFCDDCSSNCSYCHEITCENCQSTCLNKNCFSICDDCIITCNICLKQYCKVCVDDDNICLGNCNLLMCNKCLKVCQICKIKSMCNYDIINCNYCKKYNCNECFLFCKLSKIIQNSSLSKDINNIIIKFLNYNISPYGLPTHILNRKRKRSHI